jgi:carbonic anhydrase
VDAYLRPLKFWSRSISPALRGIAEKIIVSVREAANGLEEVWGPEARQQPGYRGSLIETAVCLNAAQAAFAMRQELELSGRWEIEVLYGVYNLYNHQVRMPNNPLAPPTEENVCLAHAPSNPKAFHALAVQMAEILQPMAGSPIDHLFPRLQQQMAGGGARSEGDSGAKPTPDVVHSGTGNGHGNGHH